MSAKPSRCIRAFVVAFVVAAVLGFGPASASSAFAPSQDLETDEGFDGNETEGTIDRVRLQLLGVAAITGALLVVYIWHTDPERRRRVALRRRDRRERLRCRHSTVSLSCHPISTKRRVTLTLRRPTRLAMGQGAFRRRVNPLTASGEIFVGALRIVHRSADG